MITWLQRNAQRHYKVLFVVLLAIVIVAFVFTIGAAPGIGMAEPRLQATELFGYNLSNPEHAARLAGDAELSIYLNGGFGGFNPDQLQEYALQRAAALALANELRVPGPDEDTIRKRISEYRVFAGEDGRFDSGAYADFIRMLDQNPQISQGDVRRVIADDLRIDRIHEALGGPGYVLPSEIAEQVRRADTVWNLEVAVIDYNAFQPDIPLSDDALQSWFDQNPRRYQLSPVHHLDYIRFAADRYADRIEITDEDARSYYQANPVRFPAPPEDTEADQPLFEFGETPSDAFSRVRPKVVAALRTERARQAAATAASDFAYQVFDRDLANRPEELDALLRAERLERQSLPPLTRDRLPSDPAWASAALEEAQRLDASRPVSNPIRANDGFAVLIWKNTEPSRIPELQDVRDRVAGDFRENRRRERFVEAGRSLKQALATRLNEGDAWSDAVAAIADTAGITAIEPESFDEFTRRNPPEDLPFPVFSALERLGQGDISEMITAGDQAFIVRVREKRAPEVTPTGETFAQARASLTRAHSSLASGLYLGEYLEGELARSQARRP